MLPEFSQVRDALKKQQTNFFNSAVALNSKFLSMNPDLKQSVIILNRIKNQMINAKEGIIYLLRQKMNAYNNDASNDITDINTAMFGLIQYSYIWYVAFWDEFPGIYYRERFARYGTSKGIKFWLE